MQDLVDDLLLVARDDTGGARRESKLVDLDVIVDEEVRQVRPASNIRIDMTRVSAAKVAGDASQLARVVRNVLTNAVRHAASRVELALAEREAVELLVDDDGPGIPVDERQRVFERFVRLDEARTQADGGAGLGLAIAHDVVVAHGGTIAIVDSPIGGARVVVTLPAAGQPSVRRQAAVADEPRSQTAV